MGVSVRHIALTCGIIRSSLMYISCSTPADLQREELSLIKMNFNIMSKSTHLQVDVNVCDECKEEN